MPTKRRYGKKRTAFRKKGHNTVPWTKKHGLVSQSLKGGLGTLFPDRLKITMRYHCVYDHGLATAVYTSMRGNSLYDPETAVGGAQPAGYDQLIGLYWNWYVSASTCTARVVQGGTPVPTTCTLFATRTAALSSSDAMQPGAINKTIPGDTSGQTKLTQYTTTNQQWGTKSRYQADFLGPYNGDPSSQWYWHILTRSLDGSNVDCHVFIDMTYYCEWSNRVKLIDA